MNNEYYWVYILLCENGNYYTGYTTNLERRYLEHVKGTSKCKYTRSFKPVNIAQSWQFCDKTTAMRVENYIKRISHAKKVYLIENPHTIDELYAAQQYN